MTLSSSYTFLARSSAMVSLSGESSYYLLLYARAEPSSDGCTVPVGIRGVLASTKPSSFYGFPASCTVSADGTPVFSASAVPSAAWELPVFTEDGVTYRKATVLCEKTVPLTGSSVSLALTWTLGSSSRTFTPAAGTSRTVRETVSLPALTPPVRVSLLRDRADVGSTVTVGLSDVPDGASCRVVWRFGTEEVSVAEAATASVTWQIPWEILAKIPGSSAAGTVICTTVRDGAEPGTSQAPLTLTVPDAAQTRPALSVTFSPSHSLPDGFSGLYLQGKSRLVAAVTAQPVYGAEIRSAELCVDGVPCASLTSPVLSRAGELPVSVTVTDSRGIPATVSGTVTVLAYHPPFAAAPDGESAPVCRRSPADETVLELRARRVYAPVFAPDARNTCTLSLSVDGGAFVPVLPASAEGNSVVYTSPAQTLSRLSAHTAVLRCEDAAGGVSDLTLRVPPCGCLVHLSADGKSVGVGQYSADGAGTLSVALRTHFHAPAVPQTLFSGTSWSELSEKDCPDGAETYNLYLLTAAERTRLLLRTRNRLTDGSTEFLFSDGKIRLVVNGTGGEITGLYALL